MLMEKRNLKRKKKKWELTIIKEKVVVNQWKKDRKERLPVWNLKQKEKGRVEKKEKRKEIEGTEWRG